MTKRLAVIDGKSVFYRGFYAMPNLTLTDGTPIGGVFGFASIAIEIIKQLEPDYIAVAWDIKGTSIAKRTVIFPEYKAGRTKPPEDFYTQLPILRELLAAFNWPLYELDQYEADDIMGTFAKQANDQDIEACLITGDYDMLQLIAPKTSVYITRTGSTDLVNYNAEAFTAKYGVRVDQFVDYKALVGDTSDNIPGIRGIGPKAAEKLLVSYNDLDGIYQHTDDLKGVQQQRVIDGKESAYMSQQLARIFCDAPIEVDWEETDINNTHLGKVADILNKYEFTSLVRRLPKHMQANPHEQAEKPVGPRLVLNSTPWPDMLSIDGPVFMSIVDDTIWLSTDQKTVITANLADVDKTIWQALSMATVVGYDVKQLYHDLAAHNIFVQFDQVHDIRQAAFLLNPLVRDRSQAAIVGAETDDPLIILGGLCKAYTTQLQKFQDEPKIAKVATELDFPLIYLLFNMEYKGIKLDPAQLQKMSDEMGDRHARLEQEMYTMAGYEFNIGSPAQLSEVLFTKLQLSTTGIKKGKTGYSTGQKELDKLRGQHPIIELIEQTRELAKLKNTYTDALPKLTDQHSRLHTTFNQDVAATGRLSSTNPNLQNIPIRTELGKKIREAFIPEGDKVFVSADYSQFELRLAAILANDTGLINDFNGEVDIHTKTASEVYGIPMDEVTKSQRRDAKVINFGVLYGMSPHGLAANTGMSFTQAKDFIDQYFALRAPIRTYIDDTLARARTEGYVETYFGRRRPTPDILSSNFMVRSGAERAAANMPIQGTEADLMKLAMLRVESQLGDLGDQVLQIHDSILIECPRENADKVADILKTVMESIAPQLGIKLKVDVSTGTNWGDL